jgi:outer membrane receptor for ferric coprogen and ferric-rhodotorulic acid
MIGYTPLVQTQVQVNIDRTINVNFALKSSAIEMDAVEVVAQREVIRPDISGTQEIITTDRLSDTPVMRVDEFVDNIKGVDLVSSSDGTVEYSGAEYETDVRGWYFYPRPTIGKCLFVIEFRPPSPNYRY